MALAMIRLAMSLMPMGQSGGKPGMGQWRMNQHSRYIDTEQLSQECGTSQARQEVHSLLHQRASSPDSPAIPVVLRAIDLIIDTSIESG